MKPLEGVRILEFSTMITASFSAMMLAEQGAEVIKIESVDRPDPLRFVGTSRGGMSTLFANCNRGKRSLTLDLKSDEGREVVEALVPTTDIVLTNYRSGVMSRLGLGSAELRERNPRLIYLGITGYGPDGDLATAPAYDPIIQAQTGFGAVQGEGKEELEFMSTLMCDKSTAYTAAQSLTAALYQREKTGVGQHIDLAMMDSALFFLFPDSFAHHTLIDDERPTGKSIASIALYIYKTADGQATLSIPTQAQQLSMLSALGLDSMLSDPRFDTPESRHENRHVFYELVRSTIASLPTDEVVERLSSHDVPVAAVLDFDEVLDHPEYVANDVLNVVEHPQLGKMRQVKSPTRFGGERLEAASPAPSLGEHNHEILEELGYDGDQIATLG